MKINSAKILNISKPQQQTIKTYIKEFNNKYYKNEAKTGFMAFRNKYGVPFHLGVTFYAVSTCLTNIFDEQIMSALYSFIGAKINYDFIPYINNINKKKAVQFQHYLTKKGIKDENSLLYGVSKYLKNVGAVHLPFLFRKETSKIAQKGEYKKSFETGIFFVRTDKKSLAYKLIKYLNKKQRNTENNINKIF